MRNKGISLIVLVITIVVIIILTSAIVLNISSNNPISKANEAVLKSNIRSIQEELGLYLASNIQKDGTYIYPQRDGIKATDKYPADTINFKKDKIVYKTNDVNEKLMAEQLGVIVDYTDGLIFNSKMNANAYDSASNNSGVIVGTLIQVEDRLGASNKSFEFGNNNGTSYINASLPRFNTSATISAWIYPKQYPMERSTIVVGRNTPSYYLSLQSNGALNSYWYGTSPQGYHTTLAGSVPLDKWSFVCTVWDGSSNKLYVNGILLNTVQTSGLGISTDAISIGSEGGGRQFCGNIDDVRLYNKALTQDEIGNLMNVYWVD